MKPFRKLNRGFNSLFQPGKLSIGIGVPIENNGFNPIATMKDHLSRVRLAEQLGFQAVWVRDVPFFVPSFGDAGQVFDPFVYLGYLAGNTTNIALGIGSIALPLHHPAHVAKAAASIDQLSDGRIVMGVASGDRPDEYPAMNVSHADRSKLFRESYQYIRSLSGDFPCFATDHFGALDGGTDMIPKPVSDEIPMLVTGHSQQSVEWIAKHSDGWLNYPRNLDEQRTIIQTWRALVENDFAYSKPFSQSFLIDLTEDDNVKPQPIHLGFRLGANYLIPYLEALREIGVNHVALLLRFNQADVIKTLEKLSTRVLPQFH